MAEYSIGVDLGGTNLRAAAITKDGIIVEKISGSTNLSEGRDAVISDIVDAITRIKRKAGAGRLAGVGIGVPGFILIEKGIIVGSNNLPEFEGFTDSFPLKKGESIRFRWRVGAWRGAWTREEIDRLYREWTREA